ncbi:hypothetical protein niasHT_035768 [Heterodera trifolii]|uniref:GSKIP domain-containing protein n=1 Tax=Heterodera trifolii TaxID=157864 RepID=A0ABD2I4D9_9BILA
MSSGAATTASAAAVAGSAQSAGPVPSCICSSTSQLLTAAGMDGIPPSKTPANSGPDANFLADSLGVSPLYRQEDTKRWQTAAKVYQSSRSQMHSPTSGTCAPQHFHFGESLTAEGHLTQKIRQCRSSGSPISLEDIAAVNRQFHRQMESGQRRRVNGPALNGSLELEAIAAVHELASQVKQISVSEILPRTSDLIFLNIKTYEDHPYTLELTMKGWRVCSTHTDCMNGDYHNVALHTRYFQNAKELLKMVSPDHDKHFTDCLAQRLSQLQRTASPPAHANKARNLIHATGC